jgi:pyruvate ferredoxin oxidoreductase beta subunit
MATGEIGRLAVKTGIWPLKEYENGWVSHTKIPSARLPVEEYLSKQGRFAHLFAPARNEALLAEIQAQVDDYWREVESVHG